MNNSDSGKPVGAWVGLARCGCCRAVTTVYPDPKENAHVERGKRDFLRSGLSVVYVTWQEYLDTHSKTMKFYCDHMEKPVENGSLPLSEAGGAVPSAAQK